MEETFKAIIETYNMTDLGFIKSLFEAKGIKFVVEGENFATVRPLAAPAIVKVETGQIGQVKELLKDFQGGKFSYKIIDP